VATEKDKFNYTVDLNDTIDITWPSQSDDILTNAMSYTYTGAQGSSYTINTAAGANGTSWSYGNISANVVATDNGKSLHVNGDTEITGDLKVSGVSFKETIEGINRRLAILQPNPEKLEHFESLRKAYEHYKTLEALCELPTKKEDK
jgi:hypothetical protein